MRGSTGEVNEGPTVVVLALCGMFWPSGLHFRRCCVTPLLHKLPCQDEEKSTGCQVSVWGVSPQHYAQRRARPPKLGST